MKSKSTLKSTIKYIALTIGVVSLFYLIPSEGKSNSLVPVMKFEKGDTLKYEMKISMESKAPQAYKYECDIIFDLTFLDSLQNCVVFGYNKIDWIWIQNTDTLRMSSSNTSKNTMLLPKEIVNEKMYIDIGTLAIHQIKDSKYETKVKASLKKWIDSKMGTPVDYNGLGYSLDRLFNNNWIRGKIRQVLFWSPNIGENLNLEQGTEWYRDLPMDYEAKSTHGILNKFVVTEFNDSEIKTKVSGDVNGTPMLDINSINGTMIIDLKKRILKSFNIIQILRNPSPRFSRKMSLSFKLLN